MASINPACVDSLRGVLEYVSSTGRVRNRHPAVGKIARTKAKVQKGALRLMKYQMTPRTFEYCAPKRVQNQQLSSLWNKDGYGHDARADCASPSPLSSSVTKSMSY